MATETWLPSVAMALALGACGPGSPSTDEEAEESETDDGFDPSYDCPLIAEVRGDRRAPGACIRSDTGLVRCWAGGNEGVQSDAPPDTYPMEAWKASWIDGDFITLDVAWQGCGVRGDGSVGCFGGGDYPQFEVFDFRSPAVKIVTSMNVAVLANGNIAVLGQPESDLDFDVIDHGLGSAQTYFFLDSTGRVYATGGLPQYPGALGIPGVVETELVLEVALPAPAVELATFYKTTCARFDDGTFTCWGDEPNAGRGDMVVGDDESPADLPPISLGEPTTAIMVGSAACALLESGVLQCWGPGYLVVPGADFNVTDLPDVSSNPPIVFDHPIVQASAGALHVCVLLASNEVYCWGSSEMIGLTGSVPAVSRGPTKMPVLDPRCG